MKTFGFAGWSGSGKTTLIDVLSDIFERMYEEIEKKSQVWGGEPDKDLADMIRRFLKGEGFKERK
jgi:molybdopterin-guanine dinucleotide biosynthesis protein